MTVGMMMGLDGWAVPVAAGGTAWDPSNKSAGILLSGSNLVTTDNSGSGSNGVRSVNSISGTQKVYWEIVSTTSGMEVGIANASWNFTTSPVATANAAGYRTADTILFYNFGTLISGLTAFANGNNVGFAVDFANTKIWTRVNGGNWDNNAAHDPATNTGGGNFSSLTGTVYACVSTVAFGAVTTAKFSTSSWTYSAPSGFVQL